MISENGSSTDGMATEGIAERGQEPVREAVVATGSEPLEEGGRDGGRGHCLLHSVEHGPASFPGVLHVGFETVEAGIGSQGVGRELEEPGPHHAATAPEGGDPWEVEA